MDREPRIWARAILFSTSLTLLVCTGCSLISTAAYIVTPNDTSAEFTGLDGKRVAVICRSASIGYAHPTAGRDLATAVGKLIAKNGRKVEIIDERELADWVDKNDWDEYYEVGRALKADMVVGIDLEHFEIAREQTLYQGNADVVLSVYDIKSGKKSPVWDKNPPTVMYPTQPVSSADHSEAEFRKRYLAVLAHNIGKNFYKHDSRADFAPDSTVLGVR
ncbi:MAG: hypothetical protein SGJ20_09330 [Planctomycetota bacterium]|nr:hypothetical protein [Planctomycetota bacterium]